MAELSGVDIAAILTALGVVISAAGVVVVNVISALKKIDKAVAITAEKIEAVEAKAEIIAKSVDGAASKQVQKIEALQGTVETLRGVITDQRDTAKGLAALAVPAQATGDASTLSNIEAHTKQTAENTEPSQ